MSAALLDYRRPFAEDPRPIPELLRIVSDHALANPEPGVRLRGIPHGGVTVYVDKELLGAYVRRYRDILWPPTNNDTEGYVIFWCLLCQSENLIYCGR